VAIIFCIYVLSIFIQCIVSQPVSDDSSQINSNVPDSSFWLNQISSSESDEVNRDKNIFWPNAVLTNSEYEQQNRNDPILSPVRRANFWKRANFWRKRANFWRRSLAA